MHILSLSPPCFPASSPESSVLSDTLVPNPHYPRPPFPAKLTCYPIHRDDYTCSAVFAFWYGYNTD